MGSIACAQVPRFADPDRREKLLVATPGIDLLFERYFKEQRVPGLVYGIVIDGQLVHVKGFGVRDEASRDAVTADTLFRIASMTKSFTALAILKLRDAGKLSLEDPVAKWVPELAALRYPTKDTPPLRIRQLLTHSAGFPEDNPWGDRQLAISDAEFSRWLDQGIPFSTVPDSGFEYSNYGFALLGRIVAKVSGKSYQAYLQDEILRPLGMQSTTLDPAALPAEKRASGYGRRDGKLFEIPSLSHGAFGAMGGLLTNARDLGRYVAYHLAAEPARDDNDAGPVRRSSVREMQRLWRSSRFSVNGLDSSGSMRASSSGYGYGLGVSQDCRFARTVAHGGGLPGFGSFMMWLPEYGVGMFAMANLTYAGPAAPMRAAMDLLSHTGALEARTSPPSPVLVSTQQALSQLWSKWSNPGMDMIAADNLYLDHPRADMEAEFSKLKAGFSECKSIGAVHPENWLRGNFDLDCKEGKVNVSFTLAPTTPPRIQFLQLTGVSNMNAAMLAGAETEAARAPYGKCRIKSTLGGDGAATSSLLLNCERGAVQMNLKRNGDRIESSFVRAPGSACAP